VPTVPPLTAVPLAGSTTLNPPAVPSTSAGSEEDAAAAAAAASAASAAAAAAAEAAAAGAAGKTNVSSAADREPKLPEPASDARCVAHAGCPGETDEDDTLCCPTPQGQFLECCGADDVAGAAGAAGVTETGGVSNAAAEPLGAFVSVGDDLYWQEASAPFIAHPVAAKSDCTLCGCAGQVKAVSEAEVSAAPEGEFFTCRMVTTPRGDALEQQESGGWWHSPALIFAALLGVVAAGGVYLAHGHPFGGGDGGGSDDEEAGESSEGSDDSSPKRPLMKT